MPADNAQPLVSIVLPAYNEAAILADNLRELYDYLTARAENFSFELIIVDDGSKDSTGTIADQFAARHENVTVCHHLQNFRLGQALRTGFEQCQGTYIVVLDIDLSYAPEHIERIVDKLQESGAEVVVASPYMPGGQVSNVPWLRKKFSLWANRFLALAATKDHLCNIATLTGMVRGYRAAFLHSINLRAMDVDINTEILYKSMILRARILEIPAHLAWKAPTGKGPQRSSNLRIFKAIIASLVSGFTFRPFMFFILPGLVLFLLSLLPCGWLIIYTAVHLTDGAAGSAGFSLRQVSAALAASFDTFPHFFVIGGFTLLVSIQLISLGTLALQKKKYFEELLHVTNMIHSRMNGLMPPQGQQEKKPLNRCARTSRQ